MAIVSATYFANYEDYDGFDEVPCEVDTAIWEVVSFGEPVSCRWNDNVMCVAETIQLEDGTCAEALKFDEYTDRVEYDGDIEIKDLHEAGEVILFDSDELESAMESLL